MTPTTASERKKFYWQRRQDPAMEAASRWGELDVELTDVTSLTNAEWADFKGNYQVKAMAKHLGIYSDVFDTATPWTPWINLVVTYGEDSVVHRGNILKASTTVTAPSVKFESDDPDALWTLAMVSPDGAVGDRPSVAPHWLMTNIKNGDLQTGDTLTEYSAAAPADGTGFHRFVFCLLKQKGPVESCPEAHRKRTKNKRPRGPGIDLAAYIASEDLFPSGLAFFQASA
jgi:large subunit ribosomal protein L38